MNARWQSLIPLLLAALVGAGACLIVQSFLPGGSQASGAHSHEKGGVAHYHQWIHDQLGISAEQDAALFQVEQAFERKQADLTARITAANSELAAAIKMDKGSSAKVTKILARIHAAQAELQEATLEHFFDMKPHLTEAQFDRLLVLMTQALEGVPHTHAN